MATMSLPEERGRTLSSSSMTRQEALEPRERRKRSLKRAMGDAVVELER